MKKSEENKGRASEYKWTMIKWFVHGDATYQTAGNTPISWVNDHKRVGALLTVRSYWHILSIFFIRRCKPLNKIIVLIFRKGRSLCSHHLIAPPSHRFGLGLWNLCRFDLLAWWYKCRMMAIVWVSSKKSTKCQLKVLRDLALAARLLAFLLLQKWQHWIILLVVCRIQVFSLPSVLLSMQSFT